MNYTISMTDILLAVSVGCNLWFLFLLLYERIMDTRIVRFFKGIVGLWRSLDGNEAKRIAAHEEVPAEKADIIGKSRFRMASTRTTAAIPTQEAATSEKGIELSAEESFHTFIEQAVCLFTEETNYRSSLSPFGIKMVDRLTGKPLHLDISDLPMKRGITTNRNKFVLGPSGSGKSFFMNHLVRQYYEQGTHVVLVDTGNSYQGLCGMIQRKTGGEDGVYFTYTEEKPISFNPFYTDDYVFDVEKKDSIKTLLLTLWKSEDDKVTKTESGELGSAVSAYIERIQSDRSIVPSFNTFYEYMRDDYRKELAQRDIKVEKSDFNIDNMLTTMRQYYRGGRYDLPSASSFAPQDSPSELGLSVRLGVGSCSTPRRTSTCSASGSSSSR